MPEQEDCTCYVTNCPKNNGLSADYECTQDPMPSSFVSFIVETKLKKNEIVKNGNFDAYQYNLAVPTRQYTISAVATTCITLLIVIVLILFSKYHRQIMRMNCIENNREELDGHKEDDNLKNNRNEEHKTRDGSGYEEDSTDSCAEDYAVVNETFDEEGTIARRIATTIDKLEKTLSKLDKQKAMSICSIVKSKDHRGKGVLNFLVAVNSILQNGKTEHPNFVDGVKLIQMISETLNTLSGEEIDCIQIPAVVLHWLWQPRVIKLEKQDKLPDDMNLEIIDIQNKFEILYKNMTENQDYSNSLVKDITVFVKNIQNKISLLMESRDICTEDEVKRVQYKSHKFINLYMDVQFLRSAYFIQYYTCYSRNEPCNVNVHQLMLTKLQDIEETQANFLSPFAQPTKDTVAFFALFNPSEYDCVTEYMKVKGIILQDLFGVLNNSKFAIRPQKWPHHRAVMSYTPTGTIWSSKKPDDKCSMLFEFQSLSKVDNIFLIRSVQWPSWYMYMKENTALRGQKQKTGSKREWKIVRLDNDKYMMCTRKWPSKFIYMDGGPLGKIIASYGDPGTRGYLDLIHENEIDL
ncbi:Hypothetical predicted protein [Mytilus galloprovincialis]|nr:Hypothetical predicted protein [Mytilus galloprovincialis]